MMFVVAAVAAPLHRLELRKLLLPIAQYMGVDCAEITYFADCEITLTRYGRQFMIVRCFQHRPLPALLIFGRGGRSPHAAPRWEFLRRFSDYVRDAAFCL